LYRGGIEESQPHRVRGDENPDPVNMSDEYFIFSSPFYGVNETLGLENAVSYWQFQSVLTGLSMSPYRESE
jgi:hypothetical protein